MAIARQISRKATKGLWTLASAVRIGQVQTVPRPPNSSMEARRPMRSESMPNSGCMSMNTSRAQVITALAVLASMPLVLTRYFCM